MISIYPQLTEEIKLRIISGIYTFFNLRVGEQGAKSKEGCFFSTSNILVWHLSNKVYTWKSYFRRDKLKATGCLHVITVGTIPFIIIKRVKVSDLCALRRISSHNLGLRKEQVNWTECVMLSQTKWAPNLTIFLIIISINRYNWIESQERTCTARYTDRGPYVDS